MCTADESCNTSVAPGGEFVAGGHGTDACFGDSGGPVYIDTAQGPALIGVVSRGLLVSGEPCGEGGVFVRADKVTAWIKSVTGRDLDRVPCELPADAPDTAAVASEPGGCNAAGGALHGGLATLYGLLCIASLRLSAIRRARPHRRR